MRIGNAAWSQCQLDVLRRGDERGPHGPGGRGLADERDVPGGISRSSWLEHRRQLCVDRAGRGDLGEPRRRGSAIGALEGHGVGGVRSRGEDGRGAGAEGPVDRWRRLRDEIHQEVCERGFDEELGSFTQSYGSGELDAALLLLPLVGFLPASDPRIRGTIEAVERELMQDGFVLRYRTHEEGVDGLPPGEGVFLPCSFWLANCYELLGRHKEALELFERLVGLSNDLGLLSEEYDPESGRLLGNFPQASGRARDTAGTE